MSALLTGLLTCFPCNLPTLVYLLFLALDIAYLIGLKVLFMHILTWAPPTGGYTQACREVDRLYGSVLYNVNPIYRQEAPPLFPSIS